MTPEQEAELDYDTDMERRKESERTYYDCWCEDNIDSLRQEFCEKEEDAFGEYCKEAFEEWKQQEG